MIQIFKPIKKEVLILEKILSKIIRQTDNTDLISYFKYIDQSLKGKRLRPAMLVLAVNVTGHITNSTRADMMSAALALELFHLFSLVHDDIIDESPSRHDLPTIYKKFGRDQAIILGDRLIALGLAELAKCNNQAAREIIARALIEVCDGQLLQIKNRYNFNLSQTEYYTIIQKKTSALFIAACQAGAYLNNKQFIKPLTGYALNLGLAFQIINDLDDITTKKNSLGKDIMMGEITLPLILLRNSLKIKDKKQLIKKIQTQKLGGYKLIKTQLLNSNFIDNSNNIAKQHLNISRQYLQKLPSSKTTDIFTSLTYLIVNKL